MKLSDEVLAFAQAMQRRLDEKQPLIDSREWRKREECKRTYLFSRISQKAAKAWNVEMNLDRNTVQNKHLVDMANFAMFLFARNNAGDERVAR